MDSIKNIESLSKLLEILPTCQEEDYFNIAKKMSIPLEDLMPYATWCKDSYTRNCIHRTKEYELLLLCWEEGQETSIHSHNGEECWVYLAKGKLREKRFVIDGASLKLTADVKMNQARLSYMNDDLGFHSLHNLDEGRSMTLHLYVGPIDECTIYKEEKDRFVNKKLSYHSQ